MISMTAHTVENVKVLRELQVRAEGLKTLCATAGWHQAEGTRPKLKRRAKGALIYDYRTNVATVALVHETGSYSRMIPARPVHRTAYRNAGFRAELVNLTVHEYRAFLLRKKRPEAVLQAMGSFWRSRFDRVFDGENAWDSLSEATLRRRYAAGNNSEQPLVDTRQMRDTTTAKVQVASMVERAWIP